MRIKFLIIALVANMSLFGQLVPLQSQYMFNGVALNPAYTGSEDAFSVVSSLRFQWLGLPGAPNTQALTAHAPLKNMNSAAGIQLYSDQIGVTRNTGVYGSYAYRVRFNHSTLSFGAAGGFNFIKTNFSQLEGNDKNDLLTQNDSPLAVLPDFSIGAHYHTKKFFLSFSLPMFLSHDFDGMNFKLTNNIRNYNMILGGGYVFETPSKMQIKPSFLLKYKPDSKAQMDLNLMASFNRTIEAGVSYRTQEALVLLTKLKATDQFSVMYSFGLPLNPLYRNNYGSHELSLKYNFLYKTKTESPRFLGF